MKLVLKYFFRAVRTFPKHFLISIGLILTITALDTLLPWGMRFYLEQITESGSYKILYIGLFIFAVYLAVNISVNIAWYVSLDRFGGKYIEALTLSLEQSMAETSYSEIEKIKPQIIRNVLYTDVLNIFRVIGHHAPSLLGTFAVIASCLFVSSFYGKLTTLFIFISAALGFFISWCSRKILAKTAGKTNSKLKQHDGFCTQFVQMLPLIQSHNILDYYQKKTSANLNDFLNAAVDEDKRTLFWSGLSDSYHSLFSIALSAFLAIPISGNSIANLVFSLLLQT